MKSMNSEAESGGDQLSAGVSSPGKNLYLPAMQHRTVNGGLQPQFPHAFKQRELYLLGLW